MNTDQVLDGTAVFSATTAPFIPCTYSTLALAYANYHVDPGL